MCKLTTVALANCNHQNEDLNIKAMAVRVVLEFAQLDGYWVLSGPNKARFGHGYLNGFARNHLVTLLAYHCGSNPTHLV